jgi:hypothetical protein
MARNSLARLPLAHELSGFPNRHKQAVFDRQGRVADDAPLRINGDKPVNVSDQQVTGKRLAWGR